MSRLKDLCARMQKLPELRDAAGIQSRLDKVASLLEKASSEVESFDVRARHAEEVFGDAPFRKLRQQRANCSVNARQLRDALASDPKAANSPKAQEALTWISKCATAALDGLGQAWGLLIEEEYNQFQAVANWASKSQKSDKEKARLDRIVSQKSKVPHTRAAAEQVSKDIEFVRDSFKRMGLEGKVKEFVEQALIGEGPAKLLQHPDVKRFIDETDLWKSLKVRLGN
jgi:hypothetical protein